MRVLVTGASGFIGRWVCRQLVAAGDEVVATGRKRPPRGTWPDEVVWTAAELTEPGIASRLLSRSAAEAVVHLAGHVSGARGRAAVVPTFATNLTATVALLDAAAEIGERPGRRPPRVVLAGSMEEPRLTGPPSRRDSDPLPVSPYAAAKTAATLYAGMFARLYGLEATVLRTFMVYGPDQPDEAKLVPYVATSLLRGEAPELSAGGRAVDWVYVEDVAAAFATAARASLPGGSVLDIGSGRLVTVAEVVQRLAALVGLGAPAVGLGALPQRPHETSRVADTGPARRLLGWSAGTTLDDGLRRTVDWYAR